ncbi:hypothetical protein DN062_12285 [Nitrincola tibetensis]|uniref:Pyrrolo-quinoline quinone repeat domain-containing protein n=1 Tax=Nitrincola tibetensis TaxID=2219697 RepID=A0A364NKF2_9GAMM|nr:PQQ-binding-like beta-propeller repeat protein [Nitrincola tibetensis]RAU17470.1 hypothetical protein DN062_12285 [Nitrincola tibetensis]
MKQNIKLILKHKTTIIKYFSIWLAVIALSGLFFYYFINKQRLAYEIWEYRTLSFSTSQMVIHDDNLYFSDRTNHLYSLSLDGTLNWKLDLECPLQSNLMVDDGFVIIRTNAAYQTFYPDTVTNCRNPVRLHIIDRKNGTLANVVSTTRDIISYTLNNNQVIYSTGAQLLKYSKKNNITDSFINLFRQDNRISGFNSDFHISNNTLYTKSSQQDVFAFNMDSRALKWRFTSDWNFGEKDSIEPTLNSRSLIYDEGVIYTVNKVQHSTAADVFAFDAESGVILGRYHIGAGASPGRLSASEKHIYIPSVDARVHALRKRDLMPVWDVPTRGSIRGALVPYNGVVYAGTQAGGIIGLDEKTGERVYYYPTEHPIPGTPAIKDGIIYFATNGGSIHAVRLPEKLISRK